MNQKELIKSIRQLKEIKPRKEWVISAKSEILSPKAKTEPRVLVQKVGIFGFIRNLDLGFRVSRQLAYSFAAIAFVIVGLMGFAQNTVPGDLLFPVKKIAEQSEAALLGQTQVRQSATTLNNRIKDLARVAKEGKKENIPLTMSEINANVSELAKNLKDNPNEDPQTIREIAVSLKTLADMPGADFSDNSDVKDLYEAVVLSQIADFEKTTLTEDQQKALEEIKELYEQGKYTDALEKILLINQ